MLQRESLSVSSSPQWFWPDTEHSSGFDDLGDSIKMTTYYSSPSLQQ